MRNFVVVVVLGAVVVALGAFACGPKDEKPPLTPDSEHPIDEAGAPPAK